MITSKEDIEAQKVRCFKLEVCIDVQLFAYMRKYGSLRRKLTTSVNYWQLIYMTFGPKHQCHGLEVSTLDSMQHMRRELHGRNVNI
jgi:hypothetical protein